MPYFKLPSGEMKEVPPKALNFRQKVRAKAPSDWFRDHVGSRPILNLVLTSDGLQTSRGIIKRKIANCTLTVQSANTFLYYFLGTLGSKLTEDWNSYGVAIGVKGDTVTPLSLLSAKTKVKTMTEAADISSSEDDPWMALYLLSIYRLIKAKIPEYKSQITKKISDQMASLGAGDRRMTEAVDSYTSWGVDREFNQLVAATDMFFSKFPNHALANLRIGTTGSRYRDCSALLSFRYITELIGYSKLEDFLYWIFIRSIGVEMNQMMECDEELSKPDSYFPYQIDLGLVQRSKYSAAANPMLYELIHVTGCLLKSQRSINARHISDAQALNVLMNAACVAYAHSNVQKFGDAADDRGNVSAEAVINRALRSKDPDEWVAMFHVMEGRIPQELKDFVKKAVRHIKEPRKGTIEEHVLNLSHIW